MKKYVFNLRNEELPVIIVAKNLQSAMARLTEGGFYSEDQVTNISILQK